jgi:hypothetical protein
MKRLMALSLGIAFPVETHLIEAGGGGERTSQGYKICIAKGNLALSQQTYLTRLTCPRPFLLRPWFRRLTVILNEVTELRIETVM